jgi:hypothetical protein
LQEDEVVEDTLALYPFGQVEKWLQEVCWRRYWRGWLERRPQIWRQWRVEVLQLTTSLTGRQRDRAKALISGQSGVSVMDQFALELRRTGYLHNHARMWWASYWVHLERLPWQLGAEFFFQHLLDADAACNTLSWRWVAGLHTAGKHYLVRRSNLEKYCSPDLLRDGTGLDRLDDDTVSPSPTLEEGEAPTEVRSPDAQGWGGAAEGRVGVWLHPDDLCVEKSVMADLPAVAVAGFTSRRVYDEYGLAPIRQTFLQTALADGVSRAGGYFGCPAILGDAASVAEGLAAWARDHRVDTVVGMRPYVGPVGDAVPQIGQALRAVGVNLVLICRPERLDAYRWARSGFFPFWKKQSAKLLQQGEPQLAR